MKLTFKKLRENAVIPSRATKDSAGVDLCACLDEPVTLQSGERMLIPTGLAVEPDRTDVALLAFPRSGLASKYGISMSNCVGVIDSDYRGELKMPLINHGSEPFTVENGMRIAQLVVTPILFPEIDTADTLSDTERGEGGFGSTGIK